MPLNNKEEAFVREYLVDRNGAGAARRAGYAESNARFTAYELLTKPHIRAAVQEAEDARAAELGITHEFVLKGLKEQAEATGEGTSHAARIRAYELLGKRLGMWVDKVAPTTPDGLASYQPVRDFEVILTDGREPAGDDPADGDEDAVPPARGPDKGLAK